MKTHKNVKIWSFLRAHFNVKYLSSLLKNFLTCSLDITSSSILYWLRLSWQKNLQQLQQFFNHVGILVIYSSDVIHKLSFIRSLQDKGHQSTEGRVCLVAWIIIGYEDGGDNVYKGKITDIVERFCSPKHFGHSTPKCFSSFRVSLRASFKMASTPFCELL